MEFVDDYKAKKKLAEKLRARADRLNSLGADDFTYGATTAARGAFPGMTQANLSAPIAQLGAAIMGKISESKAQNAEEEANAARMQALNSILGSGAAAGGQGASAGGAGALGAGAGNLSPQQLLAMQDMGMDAGLIKALMPKQQSMGAITQAAATPAGRAALVQMGVLTPEQAKQIGDASDAAMATEDARARDLAQFKESIKYHAPTQGRAPSDFELYQQNPELYQKYMEAKGLAKGKGGAAAVGPGGEVTDPAYTKAARQEQGKLDARLAAGMPKVNAGLAQIKKILAEDLASGAADAGGQGWQIADTAAEKMGLGHNAVSGFNDALKIRASTTSQALTNILQEMRGLGAMSDAEFKNLSAQVPTIADNRVTYTRKMNDLVTKIEAIINSGHAAQRRLNTGNPRVEVPAEGEDLDAEIDALMGGQ